MTKCRAKRVIEGWFMITSQIDDARMSHLSECIRCRTWSNYEYSRMWLVVEGARYLVVNVSTQKWNQMTLSSTMLRKKKCLWKSHSYTYSVLISEETLKRSRPFMGCVSYLVIVVWTWTVYVTHFSPLSINDSIKVEDNLWICMRSIKVTFCYTNRISHI